MHIARCGRALTTVDSPTTVKIMHGLAEDTDLAFLVGRKVVQVRLGEYDAQLCFDGDVAISIECAISLSGTRFSTPSQARPTLAALPGTTVRALRALGNGDLELDLSGTIVVIHDSNSQFESYTISSATKYIVV